MFCSDGLLPRTAEGTAVAECLLPRAVEPKAADEPTVTVVVELIAAGLATVALPAVAADETDGVVTAEAARAKVEALAAAVNEAATMVE